MKRLRYFGLSHRANPAINAFLVATVATVITLSWTPAHRLPKALAAGNCSVTRSLSLDSEESDMLSHINAYRVQSGLNALTVSPELTAAAAWKSTDLGVHAYFGHDDLTRSWSDRIHDCGYTGTYAIAENIAGGFGDAASTFHQWQESPGHNENMLNGSWKAIGLARAYTSGSPFGWYWTTDFGALAPSSSPPTASVTATTPAATTAMTPSATTSILPGSPGLPSPAGAAPQARSSIPQPPFPPQAPPAPPAQSATTALPDSTGVVGASGANQNLAVNATAIVTGTGDCLRVHDSPALAATIKNCLTDGTAMIVSSGPVQADGYTWWQLGALGWAVSEYLKTVP